MVGSWQSLLLRAAQGFVRGGLSSVGRVPQLGRWRRQFTITTPAACTTTAVAPVGGTAGVLNLPRNQGEGDIPLTAVSTGNVDALECVLLKMGVDQAEFTSNTPATGTTLGRVHLYTGSPASNGGSPGATVANANQETSLMASGGTYMNYDQILFPCWGGPAAKTTAELGDLITYADEGGHFFSTHYSYSWLVGNGEFDTVAKWDLGPAGSEDEDNQGAGPWTLNVSVAPPVVAAPLHSGIFYQWLNYVCALSNSSGTCTPASPYNTNAPPATPQVSINNPRFDADSVANGSVDWIDGTDQTATENGNANPAYGLPSSSTSRSTRPSRRRRSAGTRSTATSTSRTWAARATTRSRRSAPRTSSALKRRSSSTCSSTSRLAWSRRRAIARRGRARQRG